MEYRRFEGESPIEFQYRISKNKDLIGTWQDVADICNRELGFSYTESKYRKDYASFTKVFDAMKAELVDSDARLKDIQEREFELLKSAQKYYDQRRAYKKQAVAEARSEHLENMLVQAARQLVEVVPMMPQEKATAVYDAVYDRNGNTVNECEAVIFFADWHYGMVTKNVFNVYNTGICRARVAEFVNKAIKRLELHRPRKLHVVCLGDLCHGSIHVSARVESEELTCDQLMQASELLAEAIYDLSQHVPETVVYTTYGNHMRTVQNKNDSVHADNMERIVGWWLKERFHELPDIEVVDSDFYEFIKLRVYGYDVCCTHGDLDNVRQIGTTLNTLFTKIYGETIDYTVTADKHHIEEVETMGIDNIIVPALCGSDGYANDHRLYSKPGQTMIIFDHDGKDAVYHIKLN